MEETIVWLLIVGAIIFIVLPFIFRNLLPALYWVVASIAVLVFCLHDHLFSAALIPRYPWIMWLVWGAIFGGALAFWTVAPVYGLREQRRLVLIAPVALMCLLAIVVALIR